jgi:SAM-dependent methyltransferase
MVSKKTTMIYSFGDLNLDSIWRFARPISGVLAERAVEAEFSLRPGGVAYNFFDAAAQSGREVIVIGKVGSDEAGSFLRQKLLPEQGHRIAVDDNHVTGAVAILQFTSGMHSVDRVLVRNIPNANQYLAEDEVSGFNLDFRGSDILYFTGYSLFRTPVQSATLHLLQNARSAGARVVFDILPHDLETIGAPPDLLRLIKSGLGASYDLCIGEYHTWCYLQEIPPCERVDLAALETVGHGASEICKFASIRYGIENCGREAVFQNGRILWDADTGYADVPSIVRPAYGDLLSVSLIEQLLIGTHSWIDRPELSFTVPLETLDLLPPEIARSCKIVDIGCGYGRAYSKLISIGFKNIVGVDASRSLVCRARRDYPENTNPSIRTIHAALPSAALGNERFDVAIMLGVLTSFQYDAEIRSLFENVHNLLVPKGLLLIADFAISDSQYYQRRYADFVERFPMGCYGTMISAHGGITRHFRPAQLANQLAFGFRLLQERSYTFPTINKGSAPGFALLFERADGG